MSKEWISKNGFELCFKCSVSSGQRGDHRAGGEEEEGEAGLA